MIPEDKRDLLERPIVAALATVMADTQPQVTPVWFSYDGTHIWVNTARGRQKDINMTERPRVTLLIIDPENPYRYLEIRGVIDEVTEEGGVDHINALSKRYFGRDDYYATMPERRGKETRVIYKIRPTHTS
ncbi:MAG: PPOX class F420-dependent oxidoreductase [Phototrophicales bacterium]